MENANLQARLRQTLYSLRKQYGGGPLNFYHAGSVTTDPVSGDKSSTLTLTVIDEAVILPAKIARDVVQSISAISANKAFVYGGTFDSRARTFIIDKEDALDLDEIKEDDWIVFDNRKYEIKRVEEFTYAWVVIGRQLLGDLREQIFPVNADHTLDLESEVVNDG